ncbi:MAG: hypothetical protein AAGF30_08735 [Pseudomonadota bacterium]
MPSGAWVVHGAVTNPGEYANYQRAAAIRRTNSDSDIVIIEGTPERTPWTGGAAMCQIPLPLLST